MMESENVDLGHQNSMRMIAMGHPELFDMLRQVGPMTEMNN